MNRTILLHLVTILVAAGCNVDSTASVAGSVTLNGEPLEKGLVSFAAVDERGGSGGGDISGGKYETKGLLPGKYVVHVAGTPQGEIIMPGDPRTKRTMSDTEIRAMSDPIPPDATGNDQTIELEAGERKTLDFKLQSKSKS
jgi:hypothetical protein